MIDNVGGISQNNLDWIIFLLVFVNKTFFAKKERLNITCSLYTILSSNTDIANQGYFHKCDLSLVFLKDSLVLRVVNIWKELEALESPFLGVLTNTREA